MNRFLLSTIALASLSGIAAAAPGAPRPVPPQGAGVPKIGDLLPAAGAPDWPKMDYLYDAPSATDSAGKIVIHWFCSTKVAACQDDLARVLTLKENGHVYVVAYINGTKVDAKKLDPIRESEGVGQGTVAFGKGATDLMRRMFMTGPASIVVNTDGKIAMLSTGATPAELDARDAKVNALIVAIKEITKSHDGPTAPIAPNTKFPLTLSVTLAPWLHFNAATQPASFTATVPKELACEGSKQGPDRVKPVDQKLSATLTCSGTRGVYEITGELRFGYDNTAGGSGLGVETTKWKFEIK